MIDKVVTGRKVLATSLSAQNHVPSSSLPVFVNTLEVFKLYSA